MVDKFPERTYNACINNEDFDQYLNGEFREDEIKYLVYRTQGKIYFVHPQNYELATRKIEKAEAAGFSCANSLSQLAEYIVDLNTNKMIKKMFPKEEWPKQIMQEMFSGVGNDINL